MVNASVFGKNLMLFFT